MVNKSICVVCKTLIIVNYLYNTFLFLATVVGMS